MNRLTLKPILTAMFLGALLAGGICDLRAATRTPEPNPTPETTPAVCGETPAVMAPSPAAASGPETATPGTAVSAPQAATSRTSATTRPGLTPRRQQQHTLFVNAGYLALLTTVNFKQSEAGSLNEGFDIAAGYNWTSRRGLGAGVIYSGGFTSAERDATRRTIRLHYVAGEFVARQCVGRRVLFREAVGAGYGLCVRGYGDTRAQKGGVGLHERVSVEVMITRWLGLSAEVGGQWMLFNSPDVGDGVELSLGGILRFQMSGGVRFYF